MSLSILARVRRAFLRKKAAPPPDGIPADTGLVERALLAMEASDDGVWDLDTASGEIWCSARLYRMLGWEPFAFSFNLDTWRDMLHPADRQRASQYLQKTLLNGKELQQIDYRLRHRDGHWIWVHSRGRSIGHGRDGKALRRIGLMSDISVRVAAEQSLLAEYDVARALSSGVSRHELLHAILNAAFRLDAIDAGCIYWREKSGAYQAVAHRGLPLDPEVDLARIEAGSLLARMIERGDQVYAPMETHATDSQRTIARAALLREQGFKAILIQPIVTAGHAVACLYLGSCGADTLPSTVARSIKVLASQFAASLERSEMQAFARDQQENLKGMFNTVREFLFVLDLEGKVVYANQVVEDRLGHPIERMAGRSYADLHADPASLRRTLAEALAGGSDTSHVPIITGDGRPIPVETRFIRGEWNRQPALLVVCRDISERLATETRLRLAASVFENAREGILITDPDAVIIDVNQAFTRLTGYSREESIGRKPNLLRSGHHDGTFYADLWRQLKSQNYWQGELWNRRKNGELFAELLNIAGVVDDRGVLTHYVATFTDITRIKEHESELDRLAHYDALTHLPNRALLADRLEQALAQARRNNSLLAICYLDLDDFKPVNDRFGHEIGDRLLNVVALRLKECVRATDTVARLGGDEFVLLLGELDSEEECQQALNRVLKLVADPVTLDSHVVKVSASIGVTLFPQDSVAPEALLRHADQAMYAAKQAGRNTYSMFPLP